MCFLNQSPFKLLTDRYFYVNNYFLVLSGLFVVVFKQLFNKLLNKFYSHPTDLMELSTISCIYMILCCLAVQIMPVDSSSVP